MDSRTDLVAVDGTAYVYRAYYGLRPRLTTAAGRPTGATLVTIRMLRKLRARFPGVPVLMVFDAPGRSFRCEIYPEYKANRPPMPDELRVQLGDVRRIVQAMRLPQVAVAGVEADDVLGTYARRAAERGLHTVICTGDKDLAQLVDDQITLFDPVREVRYDAAGIRERYGVPPELIADLLALKGDASDNIPGMPGVGDVTARLLLNALGGVEDIWRRRDEIASLGFRGARSFAARLEQAHEGVILSRRLATIRTDVELPLALEQIALCEPDYPALQALYQELELRQLQAEDAAHMPASPAAPAGAAQLQPHPAPLPPDAHQAGADGLQDWHSCGAALTCLQAEEELQRVCDRIRSRGLVALDTETTSLHPQDAALVGIALCAEPQQAYYIPLGHETAAPGAQLPPETVRRVLGPVLASSAIAKVGHNLKYDLQILHGAGYEVANVHFDTMVAAHLLNNRQSVSLDALAQNCLGYRTITFEEVAGRGARARLFSEVELEQAARYAAEDALITYRLYEYLAPRLREREQAQELFDLQEMPLVEVLCAMEERGILLSAEELQRQDRQLREEAQEVEEQVFALCGSRFNLSSTQQLGTVLFEQLGLAYPRTPRRGRGGGVTYSTAEDVLSELRHAHAVVPLILRHRLLTKLISTYTSRLVSQISLRTGRLHTSFNQAGTITGRLSSSDPNLQNIPARGPEGRRIRKAFTAAEGCSLVALDYSQIELRLMAHMSGDPQLVQAFLEGRDIHRATAAQILHKPPAEVTDDERAQAKATNFGLMYGMGAHRLSQQTGMAQAEARAYIDSYFSHYPLVRRYMDEVTAQARAHGYVTTLMENRLYLAPGSFDTPRAAAAARREAINAPMQGSAAEIIKQAMVRIHAFIRGLADPGSCAMLLQIHDELIFEVRDELLDRVCPQLQAIMEQVVTLKVPLQVSLTVSRCWEKG